MPRPVGQPFQAAGSGDFLVPGSPLAAAGRWKAPCTGSLERLPYNAKQYESLPHSGDSGNTPGASVLTIDTAGACG